MQLSKWMTANSVSDPQLARKIGKERSYITKLRGGLAVPSLEVAALIEKATDHQVTRYDWPVSAELPTPPASQSEAIAS